MSIDEKKQNENESLSRVKKFLRYHYYWFRKQLNELKSPDIGELKKIVSGDMDKISRGIRAKAMRVIALLGEAEGCKILGKVIANEKEEIELRAAAAINLSLLPAEDAEPELIANLGIKEDLIQAKIIKSIGCIGGKNALDALDKISDVKEDYVRKQLAFSKALISYRLGLAREDLPFVKGAKRKPGKDEELIELTLKQVESEEIRNSLQLLEGSIYGIDISEKLGFRVNAGKAEWILLLNQKSTEKNIILPSIIKKKLLTGLLTRRLPETNTYAVQYVVLTRPHRLSLHIMVIRTDGEIFYSGLGRIKNGTMNFKVSDIKRPGTAPTMVTGELKADGGVNFKVCIPFGRRKNKRQAKTLVKTDR